MKKHRPSLAYKRQMQPNRTYADLRQKHKAKIADWMFKSVCEYYREHGEIPEGEAASAITDKVYEKIVSTCIWVPYDEYIRSFFLNYPAMRPVSKKTDCRKNHRLQVPSLRLRRKGTATRFVRTAAGR